MAIIDLYSKRRYRELHSVPDVYRYDFFSASFRVQISMLIDELLGDEEAFRARRGPNEAYESAVKILKKEYGVRWLTEQSYVSEYHELHFFLEHEPSVDRCLDAVELCCQIGDMVARDQHYSGSYRPRASEHVDACLLELNARFKEAGYGYELVEDKILRVDSELVHHEIVKPAIHFLNTLGFEAAKSEFFDAYEHYRQGRNKEALVGAAKAFESTMKKICTLNGWPYKPTDTANKLIQILIEKHFLPALHQAHLSGIQTVLSSGIPTLRNNLGGHGDEKIVEVSSKIAAYGLHLTASAIVFLGGLQEGFERPD